MIITQQLQKGKTCDLYGIVRSKLDDPDCFTVPSSLDRSCKKRGTCMYAHDYVCILVSCTYVCTYCDVCLIL